MYPIAESDTFMAIEHDITKPPNIKEKTHFIIHAAGIASPKFYRKYIIETIDVGVLGTKNMLELAKKNKAESVMFFTATFPA